MYRLCRREQTGAGSEQPDDGAARDVGASEQGHCTTEDGSGVRETLLATQKAAFEQLQQTLKDQEAQVQEQKRQLAFFERIMRPTGEQVGVSIDNLTLQETGAGSLPLSSGAHTTRQEAGAVSGQVQIRL